MASRKTEKEAQELKAKWETQYPNSEIRIIDNSGVKQIGRCAAEQSGFEILEGNNITVKAIVTSFAVLEVKQCRSCGAEVLTAAIGEIGINVCQICERKANVKHQQELNASIARSDERMREIVWRNDQAE